MRSGLTALLIVLGSQPSNGQDTSDSANLTIEFAYAPTISTNPEFTLVEQQSIPIQGATINLKSLLSIRPDDKGSTNREGIAVFEDLPAGIYSVMVAQKIHDAVEGNMYMRHVGLLVELDGSLTKRIELIAEQLPHSSWKEYFEKGVTASSLLESPQIAQICGDVYADPAIAVIPARLRAFTQKWTREIFALEEVVRRTVYKRIITPGVLEQYLNLTEPLKMANAKTNVVKHIRRSKEQQSNSTTVQRDAYYQDKKELKRLYFLDYAMDRFRKWEKDSYDLLASAENICTP
jgi:hypothetical protein